MLATKFTQAAALITLAIMTAACGGGGGGAGPSNNSPPTGTFQVQAGVAQKGPLISGSTVTVQELDSALSPTGKQYSYQITSDLGTFSPSSAFTSPYLGVTATGYYFDEALGVVSSGPVSLNGYNDLATDTALNVNILTTLAYRRVEHLVRNSGMAFATARTQAEREVLGALGIPVGSFGLFGAFDLKGNHEGDRLLAAVSSLFVNGNGAGNLSALLSSFQSDLSTDGVLTTPEIRAALAASARSLNTANVAANLTQRYAALGVSFSAADIAAWVDTDGDGLVSNFEFRVADAAPGSSLTLPAALVQSMVGQSIATTAGQLYVNGALATGAVTVAAGDALAVSPGVGPFPDGVLNIYVTAQGERVARASFVSGLLSISLTPAMANVAKGLSQQFTAIGTFSDTSTADLTGQVTWSSSNSAVATMNSAGLAGSLVLGSTTIAAASGAIGSSETLTVTAAQLESFTVTPSPLRTGPGRTAQLTATGTYSDATTANVTQLTSWASNDPAVASVNVQTGVVTGVSLGSTTIEATIGSLTQDSPISVITGAWSRGPDAPATFMYHTVTSLPNGKVIAMGGLRTPGGAPSDDVAIYDSTTQAWSRAAPTYGGGQGGVSSHTATLLPNGNILVAAGGGAAGLEHQRAYLYDPVTDHWARVADLLRVRTFHAATLLQDGRVLISGARGYNGAPNIPAELYDPAANSWSAAGTMVNPRNSHTATLLANGKVLVTGGWHSVSGATLAAAEIYDPATNTWSPAGSMAAARSDQTATLLPNGNVLITGGSFLASAEIYDPVTNAWTPAAAMSTSRSYHTATLLADGRVLVAGGTGPGGALGTTEFYDPTTNTWSAGPNLNGVRSRHTATLLPDNSVILIGGLNQAGTKLTSTELYW